MKAKTMLVGLILASAYTSPLAHPVLAAPFCAVFSYGTQCKYYTYEQCVSAAGNGGWCAVNSAEIRQPSLVAPFCVVHPNGSTRECLYYDAKACNDAAAASGGVCVGTRREATTSGQGAESKGQGVGSSNQGIESSTGGNVGTPPAQGTVVPGVTGPLPNIH